MLKNVPNTNWLGGRKYRMTMTRQQREAMEADEFLNGLPTEGSTPDSGTPTTEEPSDPAPTPPATPPPTDQIAGLQNEVARLQQMLADENSPTYRHRFEVLQGKYNAEIPRLTERLRELEAKASQSPVPPAKEKEPNPEYEAAYADLVEEHGPTTAKSLITIAQSIAREISAENQQKFEAQLQEKLKPYDEQVAQLTQGQQATAEERFFSSLSSLAPDWKTINGWAPDGIPQDPKFTAFLDASVPGTDFTYDDLLLGHYRNGNAQKVKEVFDIFRAQNPAAATATPAQNEIEKYIDPNTTGKGTAPPDNNQPTYTQAQVDAFFDSRIKGTFRGTREEAARLENEYTKAITEGRVR